MGSGITKHNHDDIFECPENYDERDFQKLVNIFNIIKKENLLIVEKNEISKMARLNIRRKKDKLVTKKVLITNTKKQKLLKLNVELQKAQKQLIQQHIQALSDLNGVANKELRSINYKINELDSLTENEKQDIFLKKISNRQHQPDFKLFFNFMKDKLSDMDNIVWTPTSNPRKSSLLIRIKSPNTRPSEFTKQFNDSS